jgi:integrase
MANIQERRDKSGKLISYSIRVFRGRDANGKQLKPWTATFEVLPTWTEKSARKKAEAYAATFEKECRAGVTTDTRLKFSEYCDYVLDLKEKRGALKHSTLARYKELTVRIYPEIGHIKLRDLRVDHLNTLYTKLGEKGVKHTTDKAKAKVDLAAVLKEKKLSRAKIAESTGLAPSTVAAAVRGESVSTETAKRISEEIGIKFEKSFLVATENAALSAKTVIEHHRLISAVLEQAVKEELIPFNIAAKATLPKAEKKNVNYFQADQVNAIREALESEPLKWKALVHLFLITGARRGEILGLKWAAVDYKNNRIHIENSILYSRDRGIYEDTPKTETSIRWITLPVDTMQLLRKWQAAQAEQRFKMGDAYQNRGLVFCQENGLPMHPDTVTDWMAKFSERHNLPHINPHAFRHTMASMLYYNKVDTISISKRLGHAQPSTTANIYAHVIEEADQRNADILSDIFLKRA